MSISDYYRYPAFDIEEFKDKMSKQQVMYEEEL